MLALGLVPFSAMTPPALAATTSVPLPFDRGQAVRIVQGYNGGTHQGASVYGLDLVLADGETSGAPVLAPFDGTVPWAFAPGEKTGCIEIVTQDRQFGAMLCHIVLDRPFNRAERVVRGQQLGSVGAAGMVGNNGLPHVHMELHAGGRSSDIVPFSPSEGGVPLEDWDLPATGLEDEHAAEGPIMSTNMGPAPITASVAS
jgi:murein DD-endopeptidase MepM/ murein hydrolase activator NlpD